MLCCHLAGSLLLRSLKTRAVGARAVSLRKEVAWESWANRTSLGAVPRPNACLPAPQRHTANRSVVVCAASSSGPAGNHEEAQKPGPLRWLTSVLKAVAKLLAGALVVAAILVAATPAFLRTPTGCKAFNAVASMCVPGHVTVQQLDLGWRMPTTIRGIAIDYNVGNIGDVDLLRVKEIKSQSSLADLVLGRSRRTVIVTGVEADMAPLASDNPTPRLTEWASHMGERGRTSAAVSLPHTDVRSVPLSAELYARNLEVIVEDSNVLVAGVVADPLHHVHATTAVGWTAIREVAEDAGDVSSARWAQPSTSKGAAAVRKGPAVYSEVSTGFTRSTLKGWLEGVTLRLEEPISAQVSPSDTLLMEWLSRVNPTLRGVVSLQAANVDVSISTPSMAFPSPSIVVDVAPTRLKGQPGPSLAKVASNIENQVAFLSGAARQTANMATEAWLGPMRVTCGANGAFELSRLDMRLGGSEDGAVHVAVWGTGNTITQEYDFSIAIKPEVLRKWSKLPPEIAATIIPDDYLLVVPATSHGTGHLDSDLDVARHRVQQFVADCAYVQIRRAIKETGTVPGDSSLQAFLKATVAGKFAERPQADLFRAYHVPAPLADSMPWGPS